MKLGLITFLMLICAVLNCLAQFSPYGLPPPHKYKKFYRRLHKSLVPIPVPVPVAVQPVPFYPVPAPYVHNSGFGVANSQSGSKATAVSINGPGGFSINVAKAQSGAQAGNFGHQQPSFFAPTFGINTANAVAHAESDSFGFNSANAAANANSQSFFG